MCYSYFMIRIGKQCCTNRSKLPCEGLQILCKYLYNIERQWRHGELIYNVNKEINSVLNLPHCLKVVSAIAAMACLLISFSQSAAVLWQSLLTV